MKKNEIYIYVTANSTSFLLVLSLTFTGDSNISCACRTACRIDIECGGGSSTKSVGIRLHNKSDVSTSHQSYSWLRPYLKFLIQYNKYFSGGNNSQYVPYIYFNDIINVNYFC